jgi:hypothetical protein
MIVVLTMSIGSGRFHKFRIPIFGHLAPPGLSIPADSYESKTISDYTLYGIVAENGEWCTV